MEMSNAVNGISSLHCSVLRQPAATDNAGEQARKDLGVGQKKFEETFQSISVAHKTVLNDCITNQRSQIHL